MPAVFTQTYGLSLLTFGFFIAVALLAAISMFREEAKTAGCNLQHIDGLCVWMLIAAIFGARLFYFINYPEALDDGVLEVLRIWNGGVSLAGGAVVAAAVGFGYTRSLKMPLSRTLDAFAPAIAIGQFFAWLGCFFSGFCHQLPAAAAWDATAVLHSPEAAADVKLHPTALFIAAGHFVIFAILLLVKRRRRFNGQTFWLYVGLFAIVGLAANFLSQSNTATLIFGLPPAAVLYATLAVGAATALLILHRRARKTEAVKVARPTGQSATGSHNSNTTVM